jgi:hypothetical protein
MNHTFDLAWAKRAFVYHYIKDGVEIGAFDDIRDEMSQLEFDFDGRFDRHADFFGEFGGEGEE